MALSLDASLEALRAWERLVKAGIPLGRCAEVLRSQLPGREGLALSSALTRCASRGGNLASMRSELAAAFGESLSGLLVAGEESGRLDVSLAGAVSQVESRRVLEKKLSLALAYPILLLLAGVFLLPIPSLFQNGFVATLRLWYLPMLAFAGLLLAGFYLLWRAWRSGGTRQQGLEATLLRTPLVGPFWAAWVRCLFFDALGHLLAAGLSLPRALEMALRASGSGLLRRDGPAWIRRADGGAGLVEILGDDPLVGSEAQVRLAVAQETGDWAAVCTEIAESSRDEIGRRGTTVAVALGIAVTGLVALALVAYIIHFWASYFGRIAEAGL